MAQKPSWHCGIAIGKVFARPESFARNPWNCTGKFPDRLESFRVIWKVSGWSGKFWDNLEDWKIFQSGVHFLLAYFKIFRTATRNAVNKSVWRNKDCSWPPLKKYAMNIWLSSLRIRAHLSWRTGKHLHVLHMLRTYSTCSYPGYQDTTTYAALEGAILQWQYWQNRSA